MKPFFAFLLVFSISCDRDSNDFEDSDPQEETAVDAATSTAPDAGAISEAPAVEPPQPAIKTTEPPAPAPHAYELDARSTTTSAYFKFENGRPVPSAADQVWHFAVKRTQFQTNSGTSGNLNFGVMDSGATDYSSITACKEGPWTYDAMLPASGAPGSQPYSGNAVLNSWYNYDGATHAVSSKQLVYLLSDGQACFKLQIQSYASGLYTVFADSLEL